jgi:hypothetical protein
VQRAAPDYLTALNPFREKSEQTGLDIVQTCREGSGMRAPQCPQTEHAVSMGIFDHVRHISAWLSHWLILAGLGLEGLESPLQSQPGQSLG